MSAISIMGAMIGFDDFVRDLKKVMSPEFNFDPEEILNELIEKSEESEGGNIGCRIEAEYTKEQKSYDFSFHVQKDDETTIIVYVGYEEL